ncbi:MAG: hypothetical protein ACUVTD_08750 [Nitrososphaerales archaeon]
MSSPEPEVKEIRELLKRLREEAEKAEKEAWEALRKRIVKLKEFIKWLREAERRFEEEKLPEAERVTIDDMIMRVPDRETELLYLFIPWKVKEKVREVVE